MKTGIVCRGAILGVLAAATLGWRPQHVLSLFVAPQWAAENRRPWFLYAQWAERCGVIPRERILELMKAQGVTAFWEEEDEAA